ncbi:MAG: biopolymer transporter ExbD [Acidobacteria bacterium]|nr:MAG: biopolymer transporter ExbD [Acidobacteriota bacterium]
MSMSVGGSKGGPSKDINITPLIDVMLVLIIIFMVIQPLHPSGLHALVPQPNKSKQPKTSQRTIVVQVLDHGLVKINQTPVTWDTLGPELSAIYKTRAEKVLFVKGDNDIPFALIAHVIDITKGVDPSITVGILTPKMEAGQ